MERSLALSEAKKYSREWGISLTVVKRDNVYSYKRTNEVMFAEGEEGIATYTKGEETPEVFIEQMKQSGVKPTLHNVVTRVWKKMFNTK